MLRGDGGGRGGAGGASWSSAGGGGGGGASPPPSSCTFVRRVRFRLGPGGYISVSPSSPPQQTRTAALRGELRGVLRPLGPADEEDGRIKTLMRTLPRDRGMLREENRCAPLTLMGAERRGCSRAKRHLAGALLANGRLGTGVELCPKTLLGGSGEPLSSMDCSITCLAFDREGVLLAAGGMDGRVAIYDWDLCQYHSRTNATFDGSAASASAAPNSLPQQAAERVVCTGYAVSALAWNPENDVEIAVSFLFYSGVVCMYDLSHEEDTVSREFSQRLLTRDCSYLSLLFLEDLRGRKLLAAGGRNCGITVWLSSGGEPIAQKPSDLKNFASITALARGGPGLIVAGTNQDDILVFDVNCVKRAAFSPLSTPQPSLSRNFELHLRYRFKCNESLKTWHDPKKSQHYFAKRTGPSAVHEGVAYIAPLGVNSSMEGRGNVVSNQSKGGEESGAAEVQACPADQRALGRMLIGFRRGSVAVFDPQYGRFLGVWRSPSPSSSLLDEGPSSASLPTKRPSMYGSPVCFAGASGQVISLIAEKRIAFLSLQDSCSTPSSPTPRQSTATKSMAVSVLPGCDLLRSIASQELFLLNSSPLPSLPPQSSACCVAVNPTTGCVVLGLDSGRVVSLGPRFGPHADGAADTGAKSELEESRADAFLST